MSCWYLRRPQQEAMRSAMLRKVLQAWCGTAKELRDARRLAELERRCSDLEQLQRQSHAALRRVHRISGDGQLARAERGQPGCLACARNAGISRRCLSPGAAGVPTEDMEWHDYGHAIVVGKHGVQFCLRCRGEEGERHSLRPCGVLEPLTCTMLGAKRTRGSDGCFDAEGGAMRLLFRPIPSGAGP